MGRAIAWDLAQSHDVTKLIVADRNILLARAISKKYSNKVEPKELDVDSPGDVASAMREVDVAVGATSYQHNVSLTSAAISAGVHFCDLGGNMDIVDRQLLMDGEAKRADVCVIPNCGLAPGLACTLAAGGARKFSSLKAIRIRVGGLPLNPQPPLNYQLVFSAKGLVNEYSEPVELISEGRVKKVAPMTAVEELEFPGAFGKLEAFNTSGGASTLPRMFEGILQEMDYKTIRYKGHCEKFKVFLDLGFADDDTLTFGTAKTTSRELFEALLQQKLPSNERDVVLLRVTIVGMLGGSSASLVYEMIDYFDEASQMTSMMRTTAFPTSAIAKMLGRGSIRVRGVFPPEQCVSIDPFMEELRIRNIIINENISFDE